MKTQDTPKRKCAMLVANDVVNDSRVIKSANSIHELGIEITIFGIGDHAVAEIVRAKTAADVMLIDDPSVLANRSSVVPVSGSRLAGWGLTFLRHLGAIDLRDRRAGWRYRKIGEFRWRRFLRAFGRLAKPTGGFGDASQMQWSIWWVCRAIWLSTADRLAGLLYRLWEVGVEESSWEKQLQILKARLGDLEIAFVAPVAEFTPDLIWVHDYHPLPAANAIAQILEANGRSVKVVYDAHELVEGIASPSPKIPSYLGRLEKRNIRGVDCLLTVSPGLARSLQRRYPNLPVPKVVPNCPSSRQKRLEIISIRDLCSLGSGEPIALYSGGLAPQRGVTDAIEAMAYLPDWHLVLVSSSSDNYRDSLAKFASELGLSGRVHFAPYAHQDELAEYLSSATVGLSCLMPGFLNHEVALPNKLFEYIHAELPTVVSDRKEQSEFVSQRGIGYVYRSGEVVELADKIVMAAKLWSDPKFSERLSLTKEEYSWENFTAVFRNCASI